VRPAAVAKNALPPHRSIDHGLYHPRIQLGLGLPQRGLARFAVLQPAASRLRRRGARPADGLDARRAPWGAGAILAYPLLWPLLSLVLLWPLAWLARILSAFFPPAGLYNTVLGVVTGLGDPLVCLLHKCAPRLVPMQNPPLFSAQVAILLLKPEASHEIVTAPHGRR